MIWVGYGFVWYQRRSLDVSLLADSLQEGFTNPVTFITIIATILCCCCYCCY